MRFKDVKSRVEAELIVAEIKNNVEQAIGEKVGTFEILPHKDKPSWWEKYFKGGVEIAGIFRPGHINYNFYQLVFPVQDTPGFYSVTVHTYNSLQILPVSKEDVFSVPIEKAYEFPNSITYEAAQRLTGITEEDFEAWLKGCCELNGWEYPVTGGGA